MKAIRVYEFGGPGVLRYEETEDPKALPGQVVVEIKAAGVNPVETYIRSGAYAKKPELPFTPGTDGAGVILEKGPGADRFRTGDRVYTFGSVSGTYAGKALCLESLPAAGVPAATLRAAYQRPRRRFPGSISPGSSGRAPGCTPRW